MRGPSTTIAGRRNAIPSASSIRHMDYPGVPVDPATIEKNFAIMPEVRIPVRLHFGFVALAPREAGNVDSIPPAYFGGNLDNWRLGKKARIFLPVSAPGGSSVDRRSACVAGRRRDERDRDRGVADRRVPDRPAQEGMSADPMLADLDYP